MKLTKLFCKRDGGGFQQWEIEFDNGQYRTIAGMVGGTINTSVWTICERKNCGKANETTHQEQAELEAKAKWKKKYKEGYRETIEDLGKVNIFWPMLAKDFTDYGDKVVYPIFVQPKLNGIRVRGDDTGSWSRENNQFVTIPHIHEAEKAIIASNPGLKIDGEGYNHLLKADFEKICSLIKKQKPTLEDLKETKEKVKHYVYDCFFSNEPEMVFSERDKRIKKLLKDIPEIELVPTYIAHNREELDKLYKQFRDDGYEGQILRTDTKYENKRCRALLKRKEFIDKEYIIKGLIEGRGNKSGQVASMDFITEAGEEFNGNMTGTDELNAERWKNKKSLIGKKATLKFFCYTKDRKVPYLPHVIAIRDYE